MITAPTFITVCVGVRERQGGGGGGGGGLSTPLKPADPPCSRHCVNPLRPPVPGLHLLTRQNSQGLQNKINVETRRRLNGLPQRVGWDLYVDRGIFSHTLSLVVLLSPQKIIKGSVNRINEWWMNSWCTLGHFCVFGGKKRHTLHNSCGGYTFPLHERCFK